VLLLRVSGLVVFGSFRFSVPVVVAFLFLVVVLLLVVPLGLLVLREFLLPVGGVRLTCRLFFMLGLILPRNAIIIYSGEGVNSKKIELKKQKRRVIIYFFTCHSCLEAHSWAVSRVRSYEFRYGENPQAAHKHATGAAKSKPGKFRRARTLLLWSAAGRPQNGCFLLLCPWQKSGSFRGTPYLTKFISLLLTTRAIYGALIMCALRTLRRSRCQLKHRNGSMSKE
jgi:hypothetical protein